MATAFHGRGPHWTDWRRDTDPEGQRTRTVQNWSNRQKSDDDHELVPVQSALSSVPKQVGPLTFQWHNQGALGVHAGCSQVPGNASPIAVTIPGKEATHWAIIMALQPDNPGTPMEKLPSNRSVKLDGFWNNTTLFFGAHRQRVGKLIKAENAQAPTSYTLAIFPSQGTVEFGENTAWVEHNGKRFLDLPSPFGWDSSNGGGPSGPGTDPETGESKTIRMYMTDGGPITWNGYTGRKIVLTVETADVPGSVFPLWLDPTTNITGTTDLHNNFTRSPPLATLNYGTHTFQFSAGRTFESRRIMLRIVGSAIPAGTPTDLKFNGLYVADGGFTRSVTTDWYEFENTDADWADGTANGAAEEGSPCHDYKAYSATTPTNWAGGAGLGTVGGGTIKSGLLGSHTYGPKTSGVDVSFSVDLDHTILSSGTNAQFLLKANDETTSGWMTIGYPVDSGSTHWSFDITYNPILANPARLGIIE